MKSPRAKLKAQADKLAGDLVRGRGYCQASGQAGVRCGGSLQWAHIITRGNLRLRWELLGALCLCAGHHVYFTYHPEAWFVDFLPKYFPAEYEFCMSHRHEVFDGDYERVINELKEMSNG